MKNECVDEDKENTAENGDNLQFCRVILPDGSTTVIYACVGQSIRTALSKLCERRHLAMPAVDVFELGSDKVNFNVDWLINPLECFCFGNEGHAALGRILGLGYNTLLL